MEEGGGRDSGTRPEADKSAESSFHCLADFSDDCKRIVLRTDNSRELTAAKQMLKNQISVGDRRSVPYRSTSNSQIERWLEEVIRGVRCLLLQSGLPDKFWSLAIVAWTNFPVLYVRISIGESYRGRRSRSWVETRVINFIWCYIFDFLYLSNCGASD
jgi:hypothetical protein